MDRWKWIEEALSQSEIAGEAEVTFPEIFWEEKF